jgi:acyl carrier protein
MNQEDILLKVRSIIHSTFNINSPIELTTSAAEIEEWDSISHIELITNIERAFKVRFALGELGELKNVGDLVSLVAEKLS